ncbi:MAG: MFS transporter [Firmicutes bacterium]|nr:MFS transporter [Bacillota bacterium]
MKEESAYSPSLLTLYTGRFISIAGDKLYLVALTFILARTHAYDLTLLWLIGLVAPLLMQWFTGSVTDRLGAKATAIGGEIICAVATLLIPFALHSNWLFVLVFINAASGIFLQSALPPMVTHLSRQGNAHEVNSVLSTVSSAAMFVGPLVGGLLTLHSTSLPFVCEGLSFIISAFTIAWLRFPQAKKQENSSKGKGIGVFWSDVAMGFSYLRNNAMLRKIIWISTLLNFGTGAISAYEALFVTQAVHLGAGGYGSIVAINGIGMVLAGMANARFAKRFRPIVLVPAGTLILMLGFIPYAFSVNLPMLSISVLIVATGLITLMTAMRTVRQQTIPVEIQGRIISLQMVLPTASASISVLAGGALIPFLPIRTIIIGAVAILFICLPLAISMFRLGTAQNTAQPSQASA